VRGRQEADDDGAAACIVDQPHVNDVNVQVAESKVIDMIELVRYYRRQWKLSCAIMTVCFLAGAAYFTVAQPLYRAQVTVQYQSTYPHDEGMNLSGTLSLALMGVQGEKATPERAKALGTLKSRAFLLPYIKKMNLAPDLVPRRFDRRSGNWRADRKPPTDNEIHESFLGRVMAIDDNATTGLITIAIFLPAARQAQSVANQLVADLNDTLRSEVISQTQENIGYLNKQLTSSQLAEMRFAIAQLIQGEMRRLLLGSGHTAHVFEVIDPAIPADRPYAPRLVLVAALSIFSGLMLGVIAVVGRFIYKSSIPP
jgi:uncharacterized protein involved in exopolysaccharide biosynthesis